jgi:PGF-pre-PGF domain-containing protein
LYDANQSVTDSAETPWNITVWRNTTSWVVIYTNSSPTVSFTGAPLSGTQPLAVSFTATPAGSIKVDSWSWDFGDGNTASTQNPANVYLTAGQYPVTLNAANWTLGTTTITKTNYVSVSALPLPVPQFSGTPTSGQAPLGVQFTDTTTDIELLSWNWSFGDTSWFNTSSAAAKNATHAYANDGTYTVILSVTNTSGTNSTTKTNYISVTSVTPTPTQAPRSYIRIGGDSDSNTIECISGAASSGGNKGDMIPLTFPQQIKCTAPAGITEVIIVPAETIRDFQMIVEAINLGDALQITNLPVAGYFRIEQNWINPNVIDHGSITFRVSNEWINEHQVTPADIVLMQYQGNKWAELPTQLDRLSGDMYYYIAITPGFSYDTYYAVTVRSLGSATPGPTQPVTPTIPEETQPPIPQMPTQMPIPTPLQPAPSETGISPMTIALGIIGLIGLLVGALLVRLWWIRRQNLLLFKGF